MPPPGTDGRLRLGDAGATAEGLRSQGGGCLGSRPAWVVLGAHTQGGAAACALPPSRVHGPGRRLRNPTLSQAASSSLSRARGRSPLAPPATSGSHYLGVSAAQRPAVAGSRGQRKRPPPQHRPRLPPAPGPPGRERPAWDQCDRGRAGTTVPPQGVCPPPRPRGAGWGWRGSLLAWSSSFGGVAPGNPASACEGPRRDCPHDSCDDVGVRGTEPQRGGSLA